MLPICVIHGWKAVYDNKMCSKVLELLSSKKKIPAPQPDTTMYTDQKKIIR